MQSIETHNCGNCGADLPQRYRHTRMITCEHCGTTSVLRDKVFETAGHGGQMVEAPSLVRLNEDVIVAGRRLTPIGQARFSYGRGWWDEFWCLDQAGEGRWLSVDEGDYALEKSLAREHWPRDFRPAIGSEVEIEDTILTVTEAETATCIAVVGEFPEDIEIGEAHLYFDLSGYDSALATYEKWDGGEAWSLGFWVDPWEVRTA